MRAKNLAVPLLAVAVSAGLATGSEAAVRAKTTVTIKAEGTDLSGTVRSPKPKVCANNRTVLLIRQVGIRGGGDDERLASDTASLNGTVYEWSTGNTGTAGKFYAKVRRTAKCKGDTSPTVVAQVNG